MNDRPGSGAPASLTAVAARVNCRLDDVLTPEIELWAAVDRELRQPMTTLRSALLDGGKRLRPAFCYWAFVGAGGDPDATLVIDAGAALELLHAAALIHDDVIDGSRLRHGTDTVHVAYANRHRTAAWRGDSDRFGAGVAILLGDLALAYGGRLLAGAPAPAVAVFDEVRVEVNIGQYLDIVGAAHGAGGAGKVGVVRDAGPAGAAPAGAAPGGVGTAGPVPGTLESTADTEAVARARRICRYKTAKYTVERPLHLGAALAAPDRAGELAGPLSAFGLPLGEAFQLRDDLLDVFGDPALTGKPFGDDLREGKPTLLATLACAAATGPAARLLHERLGVATLSEPDILELRAVIEETGARAHVEAAIERLAAAAEAALRTLPVLPDARRALGDLAAFATGRDH